MAIAFDATAQMAAEFNGATTGTIAITVAAGSDRILICCVTQTAASPQVVSSVVSDVDGGFTNVAGATIAGNFCRSEIWYLLAPTVGAHTITVTLAGAGSDGRAGALSLTGVNQAAPEASNGATGSSTTASVSVTSVADNAWGIDALAYNHNIGAQIAMVAHTNRTQRWKLTADMTSGASTTGPVTPAGAITKDWSKTAGGAAGWTVGAISLAPSGAAAAPSPTFDRYFRGQRAA